VTALKTISPVEFFTEKKGTLPSVASGVFV
jgi:hypothetical protein